MEYAAWFKKLTTNLANYKTNVLGIPGSGYYGKSKYDYILPKPMGDFNYMVDIDKMGIERSRDYNRLNSSQVLIVNYFVPMLDNNYELLSRFISRYLHKEVKIVTHAFHHAPGGFGTVNFDFYCADETGREYYFEIRYSEKGIEKTAKLSKDNSDAALIDVFNRMFKPRIEEEGNYLGFTLKKPLLFMKEHYSVYRHILAAANTKKKSYCFFLTMEGNEETNAELNAALGEIKGRSEYIKNLTWENIIPFAVEATAKDPALQGYYMELRDKYLLPADDQN